MRDPHPRRRAPTWLVFAGVLALVAMLVGFELYAVLGRSREAPATPPPAAPASVPRS